MSKILSPFPYYGGKARMSPLICSMLDYKNTDLYIEPYGGGCRTLLNKQRHEAEIYNDFGFGLVTFMSVMTDYEKTEQLVELLLENPPTEESFNELVIKRMSIEDLFGTDRDATLSCWLNSSYKRILNPIFKVIKSDLKSKKYDRVIEGLETIVSLYISQLEPIEYIVYSRYLQEYQNYWQSVKDTYNAEYEQSLKDFEVEWEKVFSKQQSINVKKAYSKHIEIYASANAVNAIESMVSDVLNVNPTTLSDVEIASLIFQLYYSSRDGMGVAWSKEKNKDIKAYYRAVRNLRRISKRMQGVSITQADSMDLIRTYRTYENVMLYLDPSYLDINEEDKNLGEIYKCSYDYKEHEKLLKELTQPDTKAKILISNYNVDLYNNYLSGWKKTYYKTFTGVGSKKGNRRLEVLWQNY